MTVTGRPASGYSLPRYLKNALQISVLAPEEELTLALRWRDQGDTAAVHRIVTAHLRLVPKIARYYAARGLPMDDLLSEGNVGLMQAAQRFNPDLGFRFATYATWWIRAAIQDYALRNRSLVKIGTSTSQKRLFYNLKRLKAVLEASGQDQSDGGWAGQIAEGLGVSEDDVINMHSRLGAPDQSLNVSVGDGSTTEWQDQLMDDTDGPEQVIADAEERSYQRKLLAKAMKRLDEREQHIVRTRYLGDEMCSLGELAQHHRISPERVRFIERRAFAKLREVMLGRNLNHDYTARTFPE